MICIQLKQIRLQFLKMLRVDAKFTQQPFTTRSDSVSPQTIFVERSLEDPVIVISEKDDVDIIGPADSISNLRPVIRKKWPKETDLQRQLREKQNATQMWNQEFWANHNTKFVKERQEYIKNKQAESEKQLQLSAEEMSEFYKKFLDQNWEHHLRYNIDWYKRNFSLLILAFRVHLEKSLVKFREH